MTTEVSEQSEDTCGSCRGRLVFDYEGGELVCSVCGVVAKQGVEVVQQRRAFSLEELDKHRVGPPTTELLMQDSGLSTFIDGKNIDANGKQIPGCNDMGRLRRLNRITVMSASKSKNLNKATREIRRISELMGLSKPVAERAAYIYRKILEHGLVRGRTITGMVGAAIYIACKDLNTPRDIKEIQLTISDDKYRGVVVCHKVIMKEMQLRQVNPCPSTIVSRICSKSSASERVAQKAVEYIKKVQNTGDMSGKSPFSIAAAAVYIASQTTGEFVTQLRLADASGNSTVTIRKRVIDMVRILNIVLPGCGNNKPVHEPGKRLPLFVAASIASIQNNSPSPL